MKLSSVVGALLLLSLTVSAIADTNVLKHPTCVIESVSSYLAPEVLEAFKNKGYVLNLDERELLKLPSTMSPGSLRVSHWFIFNTKAHLPVEERQDSGFWLNLEDKKIAWEARRHAEKRGHIAGVTIEKIIVVPEARQSLDHHNFEEIYTKTFRVKYSETLSKEEKEKYFQKSLSLIPVCEIR
jgi:hypothetical protein